MHKHLLIILGSIWTFSLGPQFGQAMEQDMALTTLALHFSGEELAQETALTQKLTPAVANIIVPEAIGDMLFTDIGAEIVLKMPTFQILNLYNYIYQLDDKQRKSELLNNISQILQNKFIALSELVNEGLKIETANQLPYSKLKIDTPISEEQLIILSSNPYLKELKLTGLFQGKGAECLAKALADHPNIRQLKMPPYNKIELLEYSENFDEPAKTKLKKILLYHKFQKVLDKELTFPSYKGWGWGYDEVGPFELRISTVKFNKEFQQISEGYPEVVYDAFVNADADEWNLTQYHLGNLGTRALALALKNSTRVKYLTGVRNELTLPIAKALRMNQSLVEIRFQTLHDPEVEKAVAEALLVCKNFRSFQIRQFKTNGLALSVVLQKITGLKHLKLLEMKTSALTALTAGLTHNTSIEFLDIDANFLDMSRRDHKEALKGPAEGSDPSLPPINLSLAHPEGFICPKSAIIHAFLEALKHNKSIVNLSLSGAGLSIPILEQMQAIVAENRLARQQAQA